MNNDNLKKALSVAGVIALLAVAYAAVAYVRVYDQAVQPGSFRSFAVIGEGQAVTVPDVAEFTASVISQGGKDLGTLQTENTNKVNKIVEFIRSKDVDEKDIQTSGYRIEPRYQYYGCNNGGVCPPPQIVGYNVTQTVKIKIRDFNIAGPILSGTVTAGANSVSELSFTVDDPARVEAEARAEAIKKAREQAETIAKAGGFKVGKLLSIDDASPFYPAEKYGLGMGGDVMMARGEVATAPTPIVAPGSQEVKVRIILRYEID